MKKVLISSSLLAFFVFTGCTPTPSIMYSENLSIKEINEYETKMIAQSEIVCNKLITPKDTIMGVLDMKGQKCTLTEDDPKECPKNSLLAKIKMEDAVFTMGFLVYPDGQFVYENYSTVVYITDKWHMIPTDCKYSNPTPFKIMDN